MSYTFLDASSSVRTADSSIVSGVIQRPAVDIASVLTTIPVSFTSNASISGQVGASIIGLTPVNVVGSVYGTVTLDGNPSISGTVNIDTMPGSVIAFQGGVQRVSVVSSTPSSMLVGASIIGLTPVNVTNTNINVSGSVIAFDASTNPGSVVAFQGGTQIVSVISSTPSSMLVGASIIGLTPVNVTNTNVNVSGSVVAFQGTNPWVIGSIVGTFAEDTAHATADKGIFMLGVRNDAVASFSGADLDYTPRASDSAGRTLIRPFAAEEARVEGYNSVVSTSVTTLIAAAGTGLKNYITDIIIANTGAAATLVTFKDGAASVLGYTIAPAGGGSNLIGFQTPIRTGVNTTFDFQATTSTSVLYATVRGFKAP